MIFILPKIDSTLDWSILIICKIAQTGTVGNTIDHLDDNAGVCSRFGSILSEFTYNFSILICAATMYHFHASILEVTFYVDDSPMIL